MRHLCRVRTQGGPGPVRVFWEGSLRRGRSSLDPGTGISWKSTDRLCRGRTVLRWVGVYCIVLHCAGTARRGSGVLLCFGPWLRCNASASASASGDVDGSHAAGCHPTTFSGGDEDEDRRRGGRATATGTAAGQERTNERTNKQTTPTTTAEPAPASAASSVQRWEGRGVRPDLQDQATTEIPPRNEMK
eukprot:jgi/Psemu1/56588/gm1.56588_g